MKEYGAGAYTGPDRIGGSRDYSKLLTRDQCDLEAANWASFKAAIDNPGKKIWLPGAIDLSAYHDISAADNLVFASNLDGMLYSNNMANRFLPLLLPGKGTRCLGVKLRGPDGEIGSNSVAPFMTGVKAGQGDVELECCELSHWPFAGAAFLAAGTKLIHSYVHHCQRAGFGYGVAFGPGVSLVIASYFDFCRHGISGNRGYANIFEACYNIFGQNFTHTVADHHGGNDSSKTHLDSIDGSSWGNPNDPDVNCPAGGRVLLHHNTFQSTTQAAVGIRGVPAELVYCGENWIMRSGIASGVDTPSVAQRRKIIYQRLNNLIGSYVDGKQITGNPKVNNSWDYFRMKVGPNWYGMEPPPDIVVPKTTLNIRISVN